MIKKNDIIAARRLFMELGADTSSMTDQEVVELTIKLSDQLVNAFKIVSIRYCEFADFLYKALSDTALKMGKTA